MVAVLIGSIRPGLSRTVLWRARVAKRHANRAPGDGKPLFKADPPSQDRWMMASGSADALILGAGMAGLYAARELAQHGLKVTVLEARARSGGRALTERAPGWASPIELGAEFIHGNPERLLALVDEAGARLESAESAHFWLHSGSIEPHDAFWEELSALLEPALSLRSDQTVADWLLRQKLPPEDATSLTSMVEGFHAADLQQISVRSVAEQMVEAESAQQRLCNGYGGLVDFLSAECRERGATVVHEFVVRRVDWSSKRVLVHGSGGTWTAPVAVIALPLAVLKAASDGAGIVFSPDPARARARFAELAMGHALRVVFRLREPLWRSDSLPPAAFVHASGLDFPMLWVGSRANETQVTAWCGGPRAAALAELSREARQAAAQLSLAKIFGSSVEHVERVVLGVHDHAFSSDPFTRGAYPYLLAGGDPGARVDPESDTLFFASDYVDPQELGTVGSAVESAYTAASAAAESLR
jgi:monoamine oxidase